MSATIRPMPSHSSTMSSPSSRFAFAKSEPTMATSSRPSSIGMSKTRACVTSTSSLVHRSSMARWNDHIVLTKTSSISSSITPMILISGKNSSSGSSSTTSQDPTVPSMAKPLTKLCAKSYSQTCPTRSIYLR